MYTKCDELEVVSVTINIDVYKRQEKCFLWSVLACIHPIACNQHRVSHYLPYEEEINMKDIPYPVAVDKIKRFEKLNANISVNVFGYEDKVYPLRITEHRGRKHHVNLLILSNANTTHSVSYTHLFCNYARNRFKVKLNYYYINFVFSL